MSIKVRGLLSLCVCVLMFMPMLTWAQSEKSEGFTVAGEAKFKKKGDIFLKLLTEEQFKRYHQDDKNESDDTSNASNTFATLMIKIGEKELKQKSVSFELKDIPSGTYALQGIQDVNGNGRLDEGIFGPKEPWGASCLVKKPKFRPPRFDEVKFELKQDISDMTIHIK